jgi:peroxiredoxin
MRRVSNERLSLKLMSVGVTLVIGILALIVVVVTYLNFRLRQQNIIIRERLTQLEGKPLKDDEQHSAKETLAPPNEDASANPPAQLGSEQENGNEGKNGNPLAKSRIARDGLKQGTPAPNFSLPLIDGGELSLEQYRGQKVLLVFSAPDCPPCNILSPYLQHFSLRTPDIQVIMVSRGDRADNKTKAQDYGLTFPIVLQKQWEISRRYAMFATPIAYLIDEQGIVASEVATGPAPIINLLVGAAILSLLDGRRVISDRLADEGTIEPQSSVVGH